MIKFDFETYMSKEINFNTYESKINNAVINLKNDNDYNGWYTPIDNNELSKINDMASDVRTNCDVFLVIGIGGSYLGAKAIINALSPTFKKTNPEVIFAGNSLSSSYLKELFAYIENKSVMINVISKSGETLEIKLCFDLILNELKKKYSDQELSKRIIITSDNNSKLSELAKNNNYKHLSIPSNIGGRYSVLTACGLLPIAVAGLNVKELLNGASKVITDEVITYTIIRDYLYNNGKIIENFVVYEPKLKYFNEWLKQLFGESQGKENKGILPISSVNSTDLHALGQYLQEGKQMIFETVINVLSETDLKSYLYNKKIDEINYLVSKKVAEAHLLNNVYSNFIEIDTINEYNLGYLIYFFELSAALGGYLLEINPFDQPGVNAYKDLVNEALK